MRKRVRIMIMVLIPLGTGTVLSDKFVTGYLPPLYVSQKVFNRGDTYSIFFFSKKGSKGGPGFRCRGTEK